MCLFHCCRSLDRSNSRLLSRQSCRLLEPYKCLFSSGLLSSYVTGCTAVQMYKLQNSSEFWHRKQLEVVFANPEYESEKACSLMVLRCHDHCWCLLIWSVLCDRRTSSQKVLLGRHNNEEKLYLDFGQPY